MAKLNVSINEFRNSYKRHFELYKYGECDVSPKSRRLLLFYSVECGLKCMVLRNIGKSSYRDLELYCKNIDGKFDGHDLRELLKELGLDRRFMLKRLRLKKNGGTVQPSKFNEMWRYGIECEDANEELKMENVLVELAGYIGKRV